MINKLSKFLLIFILATSWIFSGWPQVWYSPQIPPKIQETLAAPPVISVGDGTDPGGTTLAPGAVITDLDAFTAVTDKASANITDVVVTLGPAGAFNNISLISITSDDGVTTYGSAVPSSNTVAITLGTAISANTTLTQYKVRVTPKSHVNMPAPTSGLSYSTTGYISSCTGNSCASSDAGGTTVVIDNLSPNSATSASGVAGDNKATLAWTTSSSADFSTTTIFRWLGATVGTDDPVEGQNYTAGDIEGSATVACAILDSPSTVKSGIVDGAGGTSGCTTANLTASQAYSYTIFSQDSNGNHDSQAGINVENIIPTGSNSLPTASAVSIDSDAASVTLNEGTTKTVSCVGTVTDTNGFADISSVTADFYRTSVATSSPTDPNEYYQLVGDANCVPSGGSGNTETYTCDFSVEYYADATDATGGYPSDTWTCMMTPTDTVGQGNPASDTIEIDSLTALSVTSSINYGTVNPNTDTGAVNQTTTVTNTGNVDMDPQLKGTDMTCSSETIAVGQQQYSATAFTYGAGTALTTSDVTINITLPQRTSGVVTDTVEWGLGVPDGTNACTPFNGTNTFTATAGI